MYKHEVHKSFTYLFFFALTIAVLIASVPTKFAVNEYTFMVALIFSVIGSECISNFYFQIHKTINENSLMAISVRCLFILLVFFSNCSVVLFVNWIAKYYNLLDTLGYTWFTFIGGFLWLISFHLAKVVPNLPAKVLKKKSNEV